jgi:hypothetical protein
MGSERALAVTEITDVILAQSIRHAWRAGSRWGWFRFCASDSGV